MAKILYVIPDLLHHAFHQQLIINHLRNLGHTIEVYVKTNTSTICAVPKADFCITDNSLSKEEFASHSPVITTNHGLSPYKPWSNSYFYQTVAARTVPTQAWVNAYKGSANMLVTGGWAKMDIYYNLLQNKESIKQEIYSKFHLVDSWPLIIYAPTGIRFDGPTKRDWIKHWPLDGYRVHGSYYLRDKIVDKVEQLPVNLVTIPHPGNNRDLDPLDRIKLFVSSDILIGDISSVTLEYTYVNKPIIQIRKTIPSRDPLDFRLFQQVCNPIVDLGDIIPINELEIVLLARLIEDKYKDIRAYWSQQLLGVVDGNRALAEAQAISKFIENYHKE